MSIEYYAFALFISGLICLIAILCKVLFADFKRQQKMLDEQESKLLQLYNTVETIMEEFTDQVKAATQELKAYEDRATMGLASLELPPEAAKKEQVLEKLPRSLPLDANRIRVAGEVLERAERIVKSEVTKSNTVKPPEQPEKEENGAVFQKFFDDSADKPAPQTAGEIPNKQLRNEAILTLSEEGKTDAQIASELGITRNEVQLVIGLTAR